jgi:hypothetical protein
VKKRRPTVKIPTPSEQGELYLRFRYGTDAHDQLLWHLVNAKEHLMTCKALDDPDAPLILSLLRRAIRKGGGPNSVHFGIATGFFEEAAKAVLKRDFEFFQKVARLLKERVGASPDKKMELIVQKCFTILQGRQEPFTKEDLRKLALRWHAEEIVLSRVKKPFSFHYPKGGRAEWKPEVKAQIEREFGALEKQSEKRRWNWTRIFKRCGFSRWPRGKGGQPSHKPKEKYPL